VEPERIEEQLRQFQPQALQFFFGPRTVASCKTVVLFINKSDLLRGTPAEVEAEAKRLYGRLIDDLMKYAPHIEVRVLVGSASYGHSTHHLFAHFVEKILPRSAYDPQLLQRMQDDLAQVPAHVAHDARLLDVIAADPPRCAGDVAGPTAAASVGGGGENRAGALHTVNGSGFSVPRPGTNGASAGVGATLRLSK
jgi:hypothetical protein